MITSVFYWSMLISSLLVLSCWVIQPSGVQMRLLFPNPTSSNQKPSSSHLISSGHISSYWSWMPDLVDASDLYPAQWESGQITFLCVFWDLCAFSEACSGKGKNQARVTLKSFYEFEVASKSCMTILWWAFCPILSQEIRRMKQRSSY